MLKKLSQTVPLFVSLCALGATAAHAQVVQQDPTFLAFEAAGNGTISNTGTASFVEIADPAAFGGTALDQANTNRGTISSDTYSLTFTTPGAYTLYYRWRADAATIAAANDSYVGNSFLIPTDFNTAPTATSASNGTPNQTAYTFLSDLTYTVTQAEVNNGPVNFIIATREVGTYIDRFVFSTNSTLTPAQLSALPYSPAPEPSSLVATGLGMLSLAAISLRARHRTVARVAA